MLMSPPVNSRIMSPVRLGKRLSPLARGRFARGLQADGFILQARKGRG